VEIEDVARTTFPQEFLLLVGKSKELDFLGSWNNWMLEEPIKEPIRITQPIVLLRKLGPRGVMPGILLVVAFSKVNGMVRPQSEYFSSTCRASSLDATQRRRHEFQLRLSQVLQERRLSNTQTFGRLSTSHSFGRLEISVFERHS